MHIKNYIDRRNCRISDEELPPSTGLSCISTTFKPFLAADKAAIVPLRPPPATHKSQLYSIVLNTAFIFRHILPIYTKYSKA